MRDRLPMIVSITALIVAVLGVTPLGDAAYNAVVPRSSVGTLQLQRNAVTAAKIAPNAVRTAHVLNGSLLVEDFKTGQIPQGPNGDKGDKGDKGDPGATKVVVRYGNTDQVSVANCAAGERPTGGGYSTGGTVTRSLPGNGAGQTPDGGAPTGWLVLASAPTQAYVVCASPSYS
jgi:hypothetical protein